MGSENSQLISTMLQVFSDCGGVGEADIPPNCSKTTL